MQSYRAGALPGPVTQVGKYQILEQVGEGAMGVVYRATDPVLNRAVAIKVMNEGLAQDESLRARFLREAQAAGSLQHPNVVTIYDFGETDGHLFIAMEFVQGADLEHLLVHKAPLSLAAQLDIIIDVLNGLSYAHRRGIVHRDIKPANIRVDEEGHGRIMDFGIAHLSSSNLTRSGVMMGTPNYMAPEQITGESLTPAVDLFSTGAVLYELLTRVKPFQGDTMHNVLFQIVSDNPPDAKSLRPDLPSALNEIVKKALAKNPMDRFHSAAEMANALTAVRAPLGTARVSNTVSQRVSIERALRERGEESDRALAIATRWRAVGFTSLALFAGAVGILFARQKPPQPSTPATVPAVSTTVAAGDAPKDSAIRTGAELSGAAARSTPAESLSRAAPPLSTSPRPATSTRARPTDRPERPEPKEPVERKEPIERKEPVERREPTDPGRVAQSQTTTQDSGAKRAGETSRVQQNAPPALPSPVQPPAQSPQSSAVVSAPGTPPSSAPATKAPEPESPSVAIGNIITAYARAIGTRQIAEIRRIYPGITQQQQSAWESFFASVRSMTANLEVSALDVNGNNAVAHLTGQYQYVNRNGRAERQPASFEAVLVRDGDRWKLQTIR
ncbi:MAG TPA: protein kinase [Gemmatimonadaceae bacterium]|nr:protein kinase [Gemmatimonadaceae bacterium]